MKRYSLVCFCWFRWSCIDFTWVFQFHSHSVGALWQKRWCRWRGMLCECYTDSEFFSSYFRSRYQKAFSWEWMKKRANADNSRIVLRLSYYLCWSVAHDIFPVPLLLQYITSLFFLYLLYHNSNRTIRYLSATDTFSSFYFLVHNNRLSIQAKK